MGELDRLLDATGLDAASADGHVHLAAILHGVHALQIGLKAAFIAISSVADLISKDGGLATELTHSHRNSPRLLG
jgi:hypothetical protein